MAKSQSKSINNFVDAAGNQLDQDQITKLLRDLDYKHVERMVSMLMQGKPIGNNKELQAALERHGVKIKQGKGDAEEQEELATTEELIEIEVTLDEGTEPRKYKVTKDVAELIAVMNGVVQMGLEKLDEMEKALIELEKKAGIE
jgi:uncharacterized Fe-S cluster-containing radical SAM superfamily enzyme